jgi:transposase
MNAEDTDSREKGEKATKRLYKQGLTRQQIADQVGVHKSTIGDYIARLRTNGEIDMGKSSIRPRRGV